MKVVLKTAKKKPIWVEGCEVKLKEIKAICDRATPGPWPMVYEQESGAEYCKIGRRKIRGAVGDPEFIALARTAMPKLIAVAEAALAVASEDKVREELLCYNMGCELLKALADLEAD